MKAMRAGNELPAHQFDPQAADDDVDELDADERGDHAAHAVDEQVAAQHRGRAEAAGTSRPGEPAGSAPTMIEALKMTADRIAELRVVELHDVERVERGDAPGTSRG